VLLHKAEARRGRRVRGVVDDDRKEIRVVELAPFSGGEMDYRRAAVVSHQKPGFRLEATLEALPNGKLGVRFALPGGPSALIEGPTEPLAEIADTNVMYYPDQCIQIIILHRRKGPYQLQIPIEALPPHQRP
jgi:hypothetical protein